MISKLGALSLVMLVTGCASAGATTTIAPQRPATVEQDDWCRESDRDWDRARVCEVREIQLAADRDVIAVDGAPNGGIQVKGWDKSEILVRAKVQANAGNQADARGIVDKIEITTSGTIQAHGPRTGRGEGWAVSYRVYVPRRSNLELTSVNGGISVTGVSGRIELRTTNGGLHLSELAGDVEGSTTNGSLNVELSGKGWDGAGLNVRTTNGAVRLSVPEGYSARLETGTVNGSFNIDFPIMLRGRIGRQLTTDLGQGGKTIRAVTTNGSVTIRRG